MLGFFKKKNIQNNLYAFASGTSMSLSEVSDEVFSAGLLGDGIAIKPRTGEVYSPADGEITLVADTGHAIGIRMKNGMELILHIGLDTVSLNGEGFQVLVKTGDHVPKGTPLVRFSKETIAQAHLSDIVILAVTNSSEYPQIHWNKDADVEKDAVIGTYSST